MNKTYFFRFVLLALFFLAYQSSTIHSSQHLLETDEDCHLCVSGQQFDENLHETNFPIILESHSIESANLEQRVAVKETLDFTQKLLVKRTDLTGMRHFCISSIPLGYFSTAPPKNS
jgi:hypothetical protein